MMKIFTGKSEDGSDMAEVEPFLFTNPRNPDEWSNIPYPQEKECVGRHTYLPHTEVDGSFVIIHWICKCGKSLTNK